MNHFKQIAAGLEAHHLDAVLLTCEANRFYACGFHSAGSDGIAVVTRHHNYYFTDSRYTEAAGRYVQDAEIREANREHPYSALINEVIQREHITCMGYEDEYMTVADFRRFSEKLSCELVPATQLLWDRRSVKDSEELNCMIQAQRITEKAFDDILKEIRPGVSEKEIAARILYLMLHYGAEDKSFDPIVVSGPNGSLPHGVPSEKLIQDVQDFVAEYENCDLPLEQVRKTTYTPLERLEWQNNMKTEVLEKWLKKSRKLLDDKKLFEKKYKDTLKNLRKYKKYVDELQSQGIISEIKLPDVEDTPKSEQQLQRDAFKNKIWKKIKKMF